MISRFLFQHRSSRFIFLSRLRSDFSTSLSFPTKPKDNLAVFARTFEAVIPVPTDRW